MAYVPPLVVFTDLDGTLLDHGSYSWQAAVPALTELARINAVVVLASSKTAAEITVLQREIGLSHWPAIVENGAGMLGDASGAQYPQLRAALDQLPQDLRRAFTGFGDMTVQEVADCTGLSSADAERAKDRRFSEPGLWSGSQGDQDRFLHALAQMGITARRGGRFLTLSYGGTKADQMARILAQYPAPHSIALGDAPNDVEMLETAEFGVIINNPHNAPLPPLSGESTGRINRTIESGPLGWNTAIMALLNRLNLRP